MEGLGIIRYLKLREYCVLGVERGQLTTYDLDEDVELDISWGNTIRRLLRTV